MRGFSFFWAILLLINNIFNKFRCFLDCLPSNLIRIFYFLVIFRRFNEIFIFFVFKIFVLHIIFSAFLLFFFFIFLCLLILLNVLNWSWRFIISSCVCHLPIFVIICFERKVNYSFASIKETRNFQRVWFLDINTWLFHEILRIILNILRRSEPTASF